MTVKGPTTGSRQALTDPSKANAKTQTHAPTHAEKKPATAKKNTVAKPVHRDDAFTAKSSGAQKVTNDRPALPPKVKVVITGYGDFMGVYNESEGRPNPSGVMARKLAEMGIENAEVSYRKLEVTTDAVDAFMKEMKANPPDVIISMGVAPKAQVEARPENWLAANEDGHGEMMREHAIDGSRPAHERIASDLPIDTIEKALADARKSGLKGATIGTPYNPAEKATYAPDDSAYLCNYLNYNLTEAFGSNDKVTAGFVHVTSETQPQEMKAVVQAVVNKQLEQLQKPQQQTPRS